MPLHTQSPLDSKHWKALETLSGKDYDLKLLFALNSHRFKDFSIHSDDFLVDYSKNLLDIEVLDHLIHLAKEAK